MKKIYFITTGNLESAVLFRDDEDFTAGMNYVAIVAARHSRVKVVAFISAYDSTDPTACTVENTAVVVPAGEDVDSIKDAKASTTAATYYNLAGQKVDKDYKGIVIVNGKKVVRK